MTPSLSSRLRCFVFGHRLEMIETGEGHLGYACDRCDRVVVRA